MATFKFYKMFVGVNKIVLELEQMFFGSHWHTSMPSLFSFCKAFF